MHERNSSCRLAQARVGKFRQIGSCTHTHGAGKLCLSKTAGIQLPAVNGRVRGGCNRRGLFFLGPRDLVGLLMTSFDS